MVVFTDPKTWASYEEQNSQVVKSFLELNGLAKFASAFLE